MNNIKQEYSQKQVEQRAEENREMYFKALERKKRNKKIHRPYKSK